MTAVNDTPEIIVDVIDPPKFDPHAPVPRPEFPPGTEPLARALLLRLRTRFTLHGGEHWTQGELARRMDGTPTPNHKDGDPVAWCLVGGTLLEGEQEHQHVLVNNVLKLLDHVAWPYLSYDEREAPIGPRACVTFNDHRTHAEVLALIDEALELLA